MGARLKVYTNARLPNIHPGEILQTQYDIRLALERNGEVYNQIPKLPFNDVA